MSIDNRPSIPIKKELPKDHQKILNLFKQCVNNRGKDFSKKIKSVLQKKGVIDREGKLNTNFANNIISSGSTGDKLFDSLCLRIGFIGVITAKVLNAVRSSWFNIIDIWLANNDVLPFSTWYNLRIAAKVSLWVGGVLLAYGIIQAIIKLIDRIGRSHVGNNTTIVKEEVLDSESTRFSLDTFYNWIVDKFKSFMSWIEEQYTNHPTEVIKIVLLFLITFLFASLVKAYGKNMIDNIWNTIRKFLPFLDK